MKILAVSDIHGTFRGQEVAFQNCEAHAPDLALITGDITQFGPPEDAKNLLDDLSRKVRTIALPGNCDPFEVLGAIDDSNAENLHATKIKIDGLTFIGFGGSNPTPFNTIFELPEDEIFTSLNELLEFDKGRSTILVTHCPPKGYRDEVLGRGNMGSEAIAQVVEKYKPRLVISGHIHEAYGVEELGTTTTIVNPGAAKEGRAALIQLETHKANEDQNVEISDINIRLLD